MNNPTEILLADIDQFLDRNGMAPSVFGDRAVKDPNFVRNLRSGREPRFGTTQRVRDFMAQYRADASA
jgi:hypothetical protein